MPDEASEEEGGGDARSGGGGGAGNARGVGGIGSGINVPIHLQGSVGLASLLTPGAVGLCSGGSGASSGGMMMTIVSMTNVVSMSFVSIIIVERY